MFFSFSARFGLGTSFWTLWGLLWDTHLAPRPFETGFLGARGPAKSRSRLVFCGPKRLQERPKRHPRALHTSLEAFLWHIKPFQELQEASKTPTRGL